MRKIKMAFADLHKKFGLMAHPFEAKIEYTENPFDSAAILLLRHIRTNYRNQLYASFGFIKKKRE